MVTLLLATVTIFASPARSPRRIYGTSWHGDGDVLHMVTFTAKDLYLHHSSVPDRGHVSLNKMGCSGGYNLCLNSMMSICTCEYRVVSDLCGL